jgi:membrane-associated protein
MKYRVFVTYNVVGALLWSCLATLLGWGLGKRYPKIENYLTPAILVIVAVSLLPVAYELVKARREATVTD